MSEKKSVFDYIEKMVALYRKQIDGEENFFLPSLTSRKGKEFGVIISPIDWKLVKVGKGGYAEHSDKGLEEVGKNTFTDEELLLVANDLEKYCHDPRYLAARATEIFPKKKK